MTEKGSTEAYLAAILEQLSAIRKDLDEVRSESRDSKERLDLLGTRLAEGHGPSHGECPRNDHDPHHQDRRERCSEVQKLRNAK